MSISSSTIVFDCGDAAELARFWSAVLGRPVSDGASEQFAALDPGGAGPGIAFCQVPEPKAVKNRVHLDLTVTALDDEVARVTALGAREVARFEQDGGRWVTLSDPAGNEFDFVS